jgi:hypothetical protein
LFFLGQLFFYAQAYTEEFFGTFSGYTVSIAFYQCAGAHNAFGERMEILVSKKWRESVGNFVDSEKNVRQKPKRRRGYV